MSDHKVALESHAHMCYDILVISELYTCVYASSCTRTSYVSTRCTNENTDGLMGSEGMVQYVHTHTCAYMNSNVCAMASLIMNCLQECDAACIITALHATQYTYSIHCPQLLACITTQET